MDMIDFSRTAFNKEFKTSVSSVEKFDSKFPLVKLGSLIMVRLSMAQTKRL